MADDTGTDWAALAGRMALMSRNDYNPDAHDDLREAAVGLRRLAQLDTAIEQHRYDHTHHGPNGEPNPSNDPWPCCSDDTDLWAAAAVLGSGEQPEGPTT